MAIKADVGRKPVAWPRYAWCVLLVVTVPLALMSVLMSLALSAIFLLFDMNIDVRK